VYLILRKRKTCDLAGLISICLHGHLGMVFSYYQEKNKGRKEDRKKERKEERKKKERRRGSTRSTTRVGGFSDPVSFGEQL
jgi:hypothetical protein